MPKTWTDFLRGAPSGGHAVQIYRHEDELADSVTSYLAAGFAVGIRRWSWLLPSTGLCSPMRSQLAIGTSPRLQAEGLLTIADAETTLATFMSGGRPSPVRFRDVVGGVLDSISQRHPGRRIRAFGEMVDLLCLRGEREAALALEGLWNRLARKRDFSLLCGYQLDVFDRASQATTLPGVCRSHTHVKPVFDSTRLTVAVDRALGEILGRAEAGKVYLLVAEEARRGADLSGAARVDVDQREHARQCRSNPCLGTRALRAARPFAGRLTTRAA
jgi:hypothetical protein